MLFTKNENDDNQKAKNLSHSLERWYTRFADIKPIPKAIQRNPSYRFDNPNRAAYSTILLSL